MRLPILQSEIRISPSQLLRLRAHGIGAPYGETAPELVACDRADERRRATSNFQLSRRLRSKQLGESRIDMPSSVGFHTNGSSDSLWELGVGNWELTDALQLQ
jgi:hypothetical protein